MSSEQTNHSKPIVLFLNSWYPNRTNDTLGNFVEKHILAVSPYVQAYSLAVFSDETCEKQTLEIHDKQEYQELIVYYPKVKNVPIFSSFLASVRFFKACLLAWNYLKKKQIKPSILHVNVAFPIGLFALWLNKRFKIPIVVTEHSTAYSRKNSKVPRFQKMLAKRLFKKAFHIMPVSRDLQQAIENLGVNNSFSVIPNVVDTDLFTLKTQNYTENTNFIHISSGNDHQKNLTGILEVFAALMSEDETIFLQIVSDGELEKFKLLAEKLHINSDQIQFTGKSTTEEVATYLQQSDALVLFSNYENFPCVIPESFSVGLPVISTNVNGIPEYVDATNGILVKPKANDELKQAILTFIQTKNQFSAEALRLYAVQEFSYEAVGSKMLKIYQKVLDAS